MTEKMWKQWSLAKAQSQIFNEIKLLQSDCDIDVKPNRWTVICWKKKVIHREGVGCIDSGKRNPLRLRKKFGIIQKRAMWLIYMNIQQPRVAMHKSDWMTLIAENTKLSLRLLQLTSYEREMYLPFFSGKLLTYLEMIF